MLILARIFLGTDRRLIPPQLLNFLMAPLQYNDVVVVVVVVDPTPPTCCQQSPAPESCGSQQSLPHRWQGKAPLCRDSSRGPG